MMQLIKYPDRKNWEDILKRPVGDDRNLFELVRKVLDDVKLNGDEAVKRYTKQFDKIDIENFHVTGEEFAEAGKLVSAELKSAIQQAKENITRFHKKQMPAENVVETMPGIKCWRRSVAIEKIGLYIPGGTAPLFSTLLMLGIPAKLAGCKEIFIATPASNLNGENKIHPSILFTASLIGIKKVFKIGGIQAIGAMAYGTETIPAVYKIFGPGNKYVTVAKQCAQLDGIAIDMPAGPSEVCVFADETSNPAFVAADLLSQAEHGEDSQVVLVVNHESLVVSVNRQIEFQLQNLSRRAQIEKCLMNSKSIVVKNNEEAIELINEYAPEHLILCNGDADQVANKIVNAGSVFIGNYSPESVGDYASGTNHVLPTHGFAKAFSGVSMDSFVKKISYQKLTSDSLQNISKTVMAMAEAEGLDAHANAVKIRLTEK
jgi:histidinol dehydrogenase